MNEQLQQAIAQAMTALQQAAQTHGPQAAELALGVAWVGALSTVIKGGVSAALFGAFVWALLWVVGSARRNAEAIKEFDNFPLAMGVCLGGLLTFFGATVTFIEGVMPKLLNVYAWAGLWRPEVYLTARLLGWTS